MVLSFSPTSQLRSHAHGAAELVVALDQPVVTQLKHHRITTSSVLIPPNVEHQNTYSDPISAVFYLEVESFYYQELASRMSAEQSVYTGVPGELALQRTLKQIYAQVPDIANCYPLVIEGLLGAASRRSQTLDPRIVTTAKTIKANPSATTPVQELAERVNLSEDRLHHLFTGELGLSIHKYKTWIRLKHASKLYFDGHNLTFAAHVAGFADASHFSRTFARMYGAPPSKLLAARRSSRTFFASD